MTFGQFFMFHDFSMTIFIFQVFQSRFDTDMNEGIHVSLVTDVVLIEVGEKY